MAFLARSLKENKSIEWTIIEPNPAPVEGVETFIKGFFDDNFSFNGKVDTIVHSHVFEHVYYPNQFISHISNFFKTRGKISFQFSKYGGDA